MVESSAGSSAAARRPDGGAKYVLVECYSYRLAVQSSHCCWKMQDLDTNLHYKTVFDTWSISKALRYSTHCQGINTVLPAHPAFRPQAEWAIPAIPSQMQLVLIYRPRRDGRLSRPWCEVAQTEIRTCNLKIANPAIHDTASSAPETCWNRWESFEMSVIAVIVVAVIVVVQ